MDLTGDVVIPAPRATVWAALNDPAILGKAIPGCDTIEKLSDTEFAARVTAKIGPVKASFSGQVTLSEIDPPNGYRITGEGKGGAAGFAKGGAVVKLEDVPEGTRLSYTVDAQVGGKLAQIGSRLIEGAAKSLSAEFFERFSAAVTWGESVTAAPSGEERDGADRDAADREAEGETAPPAELASAATADEAKAMDEAADAVAAESRGLPPWIWIGGLIAIIAGLLAIVA